MTQAQKDKITENGIIQMFDNRLKGMFSYFPEAFYDYLLRKGIIKVKKTKSLEKIKYIEEFMNDLIEQKKHIRDLMGKSEPCQKKAKAYKKLQEYYYFCYELFLDDKITDSEMETIARSFIVHRAILK